MIGHAKLHSLTPASLPPKELEAEASLPEKKGNTLSRDLIDYVRYMVENHGEDYKVSGRVGRSPGLAGEVHARLLRLLRLKWSERESRTWVPACLRRGGAACILMPTQMRWARMLSCSCSPFLFWKAQMRDHNFGSF